QTCALSDLVRDPVGRARPDDHRCAPPDGAAAGLPGEVPQARDRAPTERVRRAGRIARRAEGRNRVRFLARIGLASAAVAALATPTLALGQAGAPTLAEAAGSSFPDRGD